MHEKPSCWAYKGSADMGRIVVIGSHPEGVSSGERLELMMAIFQYALAGQGTTQVKAELANGEIRVMDKSTGDSLPEYAKIGDRQYHHFKVVIPTGGGNLDVSLDGDEAFQLNLYLKARDFAFRNTADYADTSAGADKSLFIATPVAGEWYIGVECASTVTTTLRSWGYEYTGNFAVLNGVPYSIAASWDTATIGIGGTAQIGVYRLNQNIPNPFNGSTTIEFSLKEADFVRIDAYNTAGRRVATIINEHLDAGAYKIAWNGADDNGNPLPSGVYIYTMRAANFSDSKRAFMLR